MAATDVGRTPSYGGPPNPSSLSRTRDILVETMQLVEPRKEIEVPNHLLESKIYCKVAQNDCIQARPSTIHFGGFEPGETICQKLHLANVSSDVQRMHIIPPQTKYFYIKYKKGNRLVPGLTLDCVVEFYPDEFRYYYDCIRIHTVGNENLIIPIHAFPVMNTSDFPSQMDFGMVPLGQSKVKRFPLRSQAPVDFEFKLVYTQPHPSFVVKPLAGIVPSNGDIDIEVTFTPTQFQTAHMKLQLTISQFNSKSVECLFTGFSAPGLEKEYTEKSALADLSTEDTMISMLDPRAISPLDRARHNRKQKKLRASSTGTLRDTTPQEIEFAGIKFPINMDTPYAVAQVLNQEPGKLRIKDLREAVMSKTGGGGTPTRQMKEAMFEMAVRKDVYEERQNQLRWQVKLGEDQILPLRKQEILADREAAWKDYKLKRGDPIFEVECQRSSLNCKFRRTHRDSSEVAEENAQFDTYSNDMWAIRHATLGRFQQAARTIIVRKRGEKKLNSLRQMFIDWSNKKYKTNATAMEKEKEDDESEQLEALSQSQLSVDRIKGFTFPTYADPKVKDDMAVDALGRVPIIPTEVIVKKKVSYHPLKVPEQFKILGYTRHNVHEASLNYVPHDLMRPLRTGAEDEIISLPPPVLSSEVPPVNEGDLKIEEVSAPVTLVPAPSDENIPLMAPAALFQSIEYHPLHIFNPAPGLQVFQQPLPYAETDPDFHLCPLPRYISNDTSNPHMITQKKYLDREDTIKGMMSWKRFPSPGLTSLANTPTLTSVWVPRWNEPFGSDVLPESLPLHAEGLSEADKQCIIDENEEDEEERGAPVELTPEMVNAQFSLIDPSAVYADDKQKKEESFPYGNRLPQTNIPVSNIGPVPREKREQELDYFLKKKYNRLGNKIQAKIQHLNNLKTNEDLILK